jgi:hypothetical protein
LSYNEEEWSESSSDDDNEDDSGGLNLLQRLKGGGKKKRKSQVQDSDSSTKLTAAIDIKDYDEEAWEEGDGENTGGKKKKKKKKRKKDTNSTTVSSGGTTSSTASTATTSTSSTTSTTSTSDTEIATSETGQRPTKRPKTDPVLQNKKRLEALARKQKDKERAAAAVTAALAAAPKSKKLTFSSSDEDDEEEEASSGRNLGSMRSAIDNSSGKIVMFSDDDDDDDDDNNVLSSSSSSSSFASASTTSAPCPTSDEARFQLKEDYEGYAGKQLLKLQRRVGADSRFKMDKDFMDNDDDDDDDGSNDDAEFEKFEVPSGPHVPTLHRSSADTTKIGNVEEEVDTALDALRSVLGSGQAGGGSARDVKDPLRKTKKEKRDRQRYAAVGSSRDYKYDMNRYDPESLDYANVQYDLNAVKKNKQTKASLNKTAGGGDGEEEIVGGATSNNSLFQQNASENDVDPSKRYYQSKTNFWTDLYETTKGRKDVIAKKAASAEFRLTDLGLEEQFGLDDQVAGNSSSNSKDGFQFGFQGENEETDADVDKEKMMKEMDAGKETEPQETTSKVTAIAPTIDVDYLPFAKEGTEQNVHTWWEENRVRLTELYRKKHRDVLRGRRARQRANKNSWK